MCVCVCVIAAEDEELAPGGKKIRPGITSTVISELTDCNAALSQQRKKRQVFFVISWNYIEQCSAIFPH